MNATHLMGGNMSYQYIADLGNGKVRYKIILKVYRDCGQSDVQFDQTIEVGVYENVNGNFKSFDAVLNFVSEKNVNPPWSTNCPQFNSLKFCVKEGYFEATIDVNKSIYGYHLWYQRCCRNLQANVRKDEGQGYYGFIPNTNIKNSSPDFAKIPTPVICVNDTIDIENSATDPDGDSLVYSVVWPYRGGSSTDPAPTPPNPLPSPLPQVFYNSGYSSTLPFGAGGVCTVNSKTGLSKYFIKQKGYYSVAIEIAEYRNGVYLGKVRRDVQIIATDLCVPNAAPKLSGASGGSFQGSESNPFVITEGDNLCFTATFTDSSAQTLTLSAYGDPIKGTGGIKSPLATMPDKTGQGTVSTEFCWQTGCDHGRTLPYIVYLEVKDNGCPEKKTLVSYFINVKPFVGKGQVSGDTIVCLNKKGNIYSVLNAKPNYIYNWIVNNGTIASGQGTSSISVDFNNIGAAQIILNMKNQAGCDATPDTIDIVVLPPTTVKPVTGDTALCEFVTGKEYSVPFTAGSSYKWVVNNGTIQNGQGTNQIAIDWATKGIGNVAVVETSKYGCPSDTMYLFVNIYRAEPGPMVGSPSVCPNIKAVIYYVPNSSGSQYFWSVKGGAQVAGGTSNSILVNWGGVGKGEVDVVEINKYGCVSDTLKYIVDINHALIGEVPVGDTVLCAFTTGVPYEVHNTTGSTYTWNVTGGALVSGQGTNKIIVDWGTAGNAKVSVVETSYDSISLLPCVSQANELQVRIAPLPSSKFIFGEVDFCESKFEKAYATIGNLNSTYIWKLDGNVLPSSTDSVYLIFDTEGSYTLSVQEITADSCIGEVIDTVIVVHPKPRTTDIIGDSFICAPNFNNHIYSVSGFVGSTFNWFPKNGNITSGANTDNVSVDWLGFNPAYIQVTEVSQFGCVGDTLLKSVYMDKPSIELQYITVGEQQEEAIEIYWDIINAPFYNKNFKIYRRLAGALDSFQLVGEVDSSLRKFTDIKVDVFSHSYEYFVEGFDLCNQPMRTNVHTSILLNGMKIDGYDTKLKWSKYLGWKNGVQNYNVVRRVAEDAIYNGYEVTIDTNAYYQNGFDSWQQCYRIKASQSNGKYISFSNRICFTFDPILWIPDAFTPNDDRINDVFLLKGGSLKYYEITVYNRWGEKLFFSDDLNVSWDGTFHDKPCQSDAYVYIVKYWGFDNVRKLETGSFQLLR